MRRKDDKAPATKGDLRAVEKRIMAKCVTKDDAKKFATKEDLKGFATKEDLKRFATKEDLANLEIRMMEYMKQMEARIIKTLMHHMELLNEQLNADVHDACIIRTEKLRDDTDVRFQRIEKKLLIG